MRLYEGDDEGAAGRLRYPPLPPVAGYLSECVTSRGREGCGGTALSPLCVYTCERVCLC